MKVLLRHLILCALPIVFGTGAGYGFVRVQGSCAAMVGLLLSAQCHARQRQYQLKVQLAGAGVGTVFAATLGSWLEHRRRRTVQQANPTGEVP